MKIYLSSKGVRPDIGTNDQIINRAIETAKPGDTLVFPEKKTLFISSTIEQRKRLHWEGLGDVVLKAAGPMTFASFINSNFSKVSGVVFQGAYSIWDGDNAPTFNGVEVNSVVDFTHCDIHNAWGDGLVVSADLYTLHGNASHGYFHRLTISQCKDDGIYVQGGDANAIQFNSIDIRDCRGIGVHDDSFLGCYWVNVMTHSNKKGSFRTVNANNRSEFHGCYAEGDQPPIYLDGASTWHGGFPDPYIIAATPWVRVYAHSTVIIKQL